MDRLPVEAEHAASRRSVMITLLVAIVLVLVVNAVSVRLSPWRVRTYDGMIVHQKWDLASRGAPPGGIVIIGDSSGNFAVSTDVLEDAFEIEAHNLCTYGRFQVTGAGWFLDRSLEQAEAPPSLVLVVLGSRTFTLRPDGFQFAQIPIAIGAWWSRVPHVGLELSSAFQFVVARALPLFAQHRSFEFGLLGGQWAIDFDRLVVEPHGTSLIPQAYPEHVAAFADKVLGEIKTRGGEVISERERRAIRGLIADADARGHDLVFVDGPVWEGLARVPEHGLFMDSVHRALDQMCEASPRAARLGGDLQTFPAAELENPFHLVPPAAQRFSQELVRRLEAAGLPR